MSDESKWNMTNEELFNVRKVIGGITDGEKIWFDKILPALRLYRYVKREEFESL